MLHMPNPCRNHAAAAVQLITGELNECASRYFAVCRCDCAEAGQGVQTERAAELLVKLALPVQARLPRK